MANINLHRSHWRHFCASSYRLRDINIFNFLTMKMLAKVTEGKCEIYADRYRISSGIQILMGIFPSSYRLRDNNIFNV